MKADRQMICMKVLNILDELDGDIGEKRDFLNMINELIKKKPTRAMEIISEYMGEGV